MKLIWCKCEMVSVVGIDDNEHCPECDSGPEARVIIQSDNWTTEKRHAFFDFLDTINSADELSKVAA